MKNALLIIEIILGLLLCFVTIETYVFYKKNENKKIGKIRKPLLFRIKIFTVLTVLSAVIGIINIINNR